MPSTQRRTTTLKILACRAVYSGRNAKNHQYTIYEVDAARGDGTMVNEKLRAFQPLPVGQEVEVEVEPFNSERHGRSFTLHPKSAPVSSSAGRINELTAVIEQLAERVDALEKRLAELSPVVAAPEADKSW